MQLVRDELKNNFETPVDGHGSSPEFFCEI